MAYVAQAELDKAVLFRMFEWSQHSAKRLTADDLSKVFLGAVSAKRVQMSLETLEEMALAHVSYGSMGSTAEITREGYQAVESQLLDTTSFYSWYAKFGDEWLLREQDELFGVPAANRIVTLDHNQPEYQQISGNLSELYVAVSGDNELDEDARNSLAQGMAGAVELWKAGQLKALQIKVGILMAVEDVKPVAKAKFYESLVDGLVLLITTLLRALGIKLGNF